MMSRKKRTKTSDKSIENLYLNKDFVAPRPSALETIYEEPRKCQATGTSLHMTSHKFKRKIEFCSYIPSAKKMKLRKRKAMMCSSSSSNGIPAKPNVTSRKKSKKKPISSCDSTADELSEISNARCQSQTTIARRQSTNAKSPVSIAHRTRNRMLGTFRRECKNSDVTNKKR